MESKIREEIYTDLIQEMSTSTHESITEIVDNEVKLFVHWTKNGNVEKIDKNTYIEQTTQWKKKFTEDELIRFYIKEFYLK